MQEPVFEPAYLHLAGVQPFDEPPGRAVGFTRESEQVPVDGQGRLVRLERVADSAPFGPAGVDGLAAQRPGPALRRRGLGADQQPHAAELVERVGEQRVAAGVEVGGGDIEAHLVDQPVGCVADEAVERVGNRRAVLVDGQFRLRHPATRHRELPPASPGFEAPSRPTRGIGEQPPEAERPRSGCATCSRQPTTRFGASRAVPGCRTRSDPQGRAGTADRPRENAGRRACPSGGRSVPACPEWRPLLLECGGAPRDTRSEGRGRSRRSQPARR